MKQALGSHGLMSVPLVLRIFFLYVLYAILTQRAYIGNGEKSCFILQQIHWAETRDVI